MTTNAFPISIGLDFGTFQTKACVRFKRSVNAPAEYHFVPINDVGVGMDAYFLPSVISETPDDTFVIGSILDDARFTFSFFKIASAEDEEFRLDANLTTPKYDPARFKPYTPEFLAVIYLSYVIDKIKRYVRDVLQPGQQKTENKGFFARFQTAETTPVTYQWTIQMGVPTEYKERHNALRKRKFQQMLYMALELSKLDEGRIVYSEKTGIVQRHVEQIFEELQRRFERHSVREIRQSDWDDLLQDARISVFPETAAGLHFLVRTNKLTKDKYYLALDIGGGSTDVSFFKVEANDTFTYLASKSAMVATNDLGIEMFGSGLRPTQLRKDLIAALSRQGIQSDNGYRAAFRKVLQSINKHVYKMFNSQVYFRFEDLNATAVYENTICYLYGGGALMPVIKPNPERLLEQILIHDNGVRDSLTSTNTYVDVRPIRDLQLTEHVHPATWKEKMDFLIVPLGLSLALSDDITTRLNEDFYTRDDQKAPTGLFDVHTARWV